MLSKILVPLDPNDEEAAVLWHVARLLRRQDAEVELFATVVPILEGLLERGDRKDREERHVDLRLDQARRRLGALAERLRGEGVNVRHEVVLGDPADRILRRIEAWSPSLVAMGTHGRRGISRWIRGSVAERVLRRAASPLLLTKVTQPAPEGAATEGRYERILVPLDGSDRSASVLPLAEAVARQFDAELLLLRVAHLPVGQVTVPDAAIAQSMADLQGSLEQVRDRLKADGLRARSVVTMGDPASEILERAEREKVDLLAMSTHGYSGLDRWLFGSVAENVLRHSQVPLLVKRTVIPSEGAA